MKRFWMQTFGLVALLACCAVARGQSSNLSYSATLQWNYPSTNFQFKVYAATGTVAFQLLGTVTNRTSNLTTNLPAGVDNRFYVTALDPKTLLESDPSNVVTNRFVLVKPAPVTNLVITNLVLQ